MTPLLPLFLQIFTLVKGEHQWDQMFARQAPDFLCNNGTEVQQACSVERNATECRRLYCTEKCKRLLPGLRTCCKYADPVQAFECLDRVDAQFTATPINIAPACTAVGFSYASCAVRTPGFENLALTQKAACLCYKTGAWDPAPYDSAFAECWYYNQGYLSTAPAAVRSSLIAAGASLTPAADGYLSLYSSYEALHPSATGDSLSLCLVIGNVLMATKTATPVGTPIAMTPSATSRGSHSPKTSPKPTITGFSSTSSSTNVAAPVSMAPTKQVGVLGAYIAMLALMF